MRECYSSLIPTAMRELKSGVCVSMACLDNDRLQ